MKIQPASHFKGIGECSGGDGTSDGGCPPSMSPSHQGPKVVPVEGQRLEEDTFKPCPLMPWCGQVPLIFHTGKVGIKYTPRASWMGQERSPWTGWLSLSQHKQLQLKEMLEHVTLWLYYAPLRCIVTLHYVISVCLTLYTNTLHPLDLFWRGGKS